MVMTDWVEVAERRTPHGRPDPPAPWHGDWYNEDDESVTEASPDFAEPEKAVAWALERCDRVFVTFRDEVVWAGSGAAPLHPILGEPLSTFDAALARARVTNADADLERLLRLDRRDPQMLHSLRNDRGLSLEELAHLAHVDEGWLADAELGQFSDGPRERFRTFLRVASVLVRGIECDPSEFDRTFGVAVVLLHSRILDSAINFVWKRHRMATASSGE
jgi:transcriptional regulator with XRE-family HTH domain